jgi:hypothetical protein
MRSNLARGRPTWWVILAVALALMALVAATATRSSSAGPAHRPRTAAGPTTTTTSKDSTGEIGSTTVPTLGGVTSPGGASGLSGLGAVDQGSVTHPTTSTTVAAAPPTTSTTQAPSAEGTSYPGFLQPPQDSAATYGFTGQGSTRISATWSDTTYLTLNVTCSGFNQSTGGSSALSMQIPDARGACQAILSESTGETDTLSYTLVIDPNGS